MSTHLQNEIGHLRKVKSQDELQVDVLDYHSDGHHWTHSLRHFSHYFGELGDYLTSKPPPSLKARVVIYSRHEDNPTGLKGFTADLRQKQHMPAVAVKLATLLCGVWELDSEAFNFLVCEGQRESGELVVLIQQSRIDRFTGATEPETFSTEHLSMPCRPPSWESDFSMYINAFHTRPPREVSITLFCISGRDGDPGCQKNIMICGNDEVLQRLTARMADARAPTNFPIDAFLLRRYAEEALQAQADINLLLIALYLPKVGYIARESPSYSKLNYILHLRDQLETIIRRLDVLAKSGRDSPGGSASARSDPAQVPDRKWQEECEALSKRAAALLEEASKIYDTIKDQLAGKDSARNRLFAVLAAIYLPFTLASGVLGMNIQWGTPLPKWWVLFAIGLPLAVATIAAPLSFESSYRIAQRFASKRPATFRYLVWGAPLGAVCIIILVVVLLEVTKR